MIVTWIEFCLLTVVIIVVVVVVSAANSKRRRPPIKLHSFCVWPFRHTSSYESTTRLVVNKRANAPVILFLYACYASHNYK